MNKRTKVDRVERIRECLKLYAHKETEDMKHALTWGITEPISRVVKNLDTTSEVVGVRNISRGLLVGPSDIVNRILRMLIDRVSEKDLKEFAFMSSINQHTHLLDIIMTPDTYKEVFGDIIAIFFDLMRDSGHTDRAVLLEMLINGTQRIVPRIDDFQAAIDRLIDEDVLSVVGFLLGPFYDMIMRSRDDKRIKQEIEIVESLQCINDSMFSEYVPPMYLITRRVGEGSPALSRGARDHWISSHCSLGGGS
jgi:hypothetical protein